MTLKELWTWWQAIWFEPRPVTPIALYRIIFGCLVLSFGFLLWPDLTNFFGEHAIVSMATARQWWHGPTLNVLLLFPGDDNTLISLFALFMVAALGLTVGLFTRVSAFVVYLGLVALTFRNPFVFHSGDCFMRVASFLLMLSPCGEALSLDNLLKVAISKDPASVGRSPHPPWAQRLIQFNLAAVYADAFWTKAMSEQWLSGLSVYYATRLDQFKRLPVPLLFDHVWICKLLSWGTLTIELAMWTLIWFRDIRYWLLAAAILFHLGLDWAMNIPLFQLIMIATFVAFVDPADLTKVMNAIKARARNLVGEPLPVVVSSVSTAGPRMAELIRRLDIFGLLDLTNQACADDLQPGVLVAVRSGNQWHSGLAVWRCLAGRLPLLWIFYPFLQLPGMRWLASRLNKRPACVPKAN